MGHPSLCGVQSLDGDERAAANRVLLLSTMAFTLLFAVWLMLGVLARARSGPSWR